MIADDLRLAYGVQILEVGMLLAVRVLFMFFVTSVVLVGSLVGCSRGSKENGGGGVDGGGGEFIVYSREEVVKTLNEAWQLLISESADNPFVIAYYSLYSIEQESQSSDERKLFRMLRKIISNGKDVPYRHFLVKRYPESYRPDPLPDGSMPDGWGSTLFITQQLKSKQLNLNEDGLCNGPGHKNYLAAVSHLSFSGEICVSVHGLMRRSSPFIKYDLLALLAHEIAHLYGYGEDDARLLQKYFILNMAHITRTDGLFARLNLSRSIREGFTQHWPVVVFYDEFDKGASKRLFRMWNAIENAANELSYPEDGDDIHPVQPKENRNLRMLFFDLRGDIYSLAQEVESRENDTKSKKVTAEDRVRFRDLALRFIDIEERTYDYFFGKKWPQRNYAVRTREDLEKQRQLIISATEQIATVVSRPRLDCISDWLPTPPYPWPNYGKGEKDVEVRRWLELMWNDYECPRKGSAGFEFQTEPKLDEAPKD